MNKRIHDASADLLRACQMALNHLRSRVPSERSDLSHRTVVRCLTEAVEKALGVSEDGQEATREIILAARGE